MHGDEAPGSVEIFQSWFVPGPNSTGGLADSETPEPFGPRNCGHQESPLAQHATPVTKPRSRTIYFFIVVLELLGWGYPSSAAHGQTVSTNDKDKKGAPVNLVLGLRRRSNFSSQEIRWRVQLASWGIERLALRHDVPRHIR
jgi:hypothetical protein